MSEQFETNISQNLVNTQNQMRKGFEEINLRIDSLSKTFFEEQKIRTKLEADLQILRTKIENMLEDIEDIQEKISEEFGQKESFIKRLFG